MKYNKVNVEVKGLKVGEEVKVITERYTDLHATVTEITDTVVTVEVPTYYGNEKIKMDFKVVDDIVENMFVAK